MTEGAAYQRKPPPASHPGRKTERGERGDTGSGGWEESGGKQGKKGSFLVLLGKLSRATESTGQQAPNLGQHHPGHAFFPGVWGQTEPAPGLHGHTDRPLWGVRAHRTRSRGARPPAAARPSALPLHSREHLPPAAGGGSCAVPSGGPGTTAEEGARWPSRCVRAPGLSRGVPSIAPHPPAAHAHRALPRSLKMAPLRAAVLPPRAHAQAS